MFESAPEIITKIAGRMPTSYCQPVLKNQISTSVIDSVKRINGRILVGKSRVGERHYDAISMTGKGTVETRIFGSPVHLEELMARIELVRNIAHASRDNKISELTIGQLLTYKDSPNIDKLLKDLIPTNFDLNRKLQPEREITMYNMYCTGKSSQSVSELRILQTGGEDGEGSIRKDTYEAMSHDIHRYNRVDNSIPNDWCDKYANIDDDEYYTPDDEDEDEDYEDEYEY